MLVLKLSLVPSLIGLITLAGRRWGPAMAGWLSGFPVVAGPILLLVALEQGPSFAANAAAGAVSAVFSNVFFCLGYSWTATRFPWWASLAGGFATYAIAATLITALAPSIYWTLAITVIVLMIAVHAFPKHMASKPPAQPSPAELPARMIAGAVLVLLVTFFASNLGPRLSGLFSAFPMMACVLAGFSHSASGPGFATRLLQGMVSGFYSLAIFCFTLAITLPVWGVAGAFPVALVCATLVSAASLWLKSGSLIQRKT